MSVMEKPRFTPLVVALEAACVILLFLTFVYVIAVWPTLPGQLPSHFNFSGEIDGWSRRSIVWLMPAAGLAIYLITSLSMFFPKYINLPVKVTDENRDRVMRESLLMLGWLKLLVLALFATITFFTVRIAPLPAWLMFIYVGLLTLNLVLYFARVKIAARPAEDRHEIY